MGCRTGFYLLMFGDLKPEDVADDVIAMCDFILSYDGEVPGARPKECGNFSEQNLNTAKYYVLKYRDDLAKNRRFVYPD